MGKILHFNHEARLLLQQGVDELRGKGIDPD